MVEDNQKSANKKKLAFSIILMIGLLFVLLSIIQITVVSRTALSSAGSSYEADCEQITQSYSLALTNKMNTYIKEIRAYVQADVVQSADASRIVAWLRTKGGSRTPEFERILFCGPDGIAYYDTGAQEDISNTSYFKAFMKEGKFQYVDNPTVDPVTEKEIIHIGHLVRVHGKTVGFFAGVLSLDMVQKIVANIQLGKTGSAWLLASDGMVLEHQNPEYIMKMNFLTGLDAKHADLANVAEKMCNRETGSAWVKGLNGGKDFITYAPISNTPWSFAFDISASQVNQTAMRITTVMTFIGIVILALLLLVSGTLIYKELKPLQTVEKTITEIASGNADLTKRISIKSNNEIGSVVFGFNSFTEKLQSIVKELKKSKDLLTTAGTDLHASTQDTSASINEILTNIRSMSNHITNQSAGVEETASAVNEIASNIASLEHMIETQANGVTDASSAVEQMIGNIEAVNNSVEKMAVSFNELEKRAVDGAAKQQQVNGRIDQIESESQMLQEANTAIASIASQTNLLAMNAAIEAAHAGEAGKGFSVVADEIRKLSETSTTQSKTIRDELKKIKDSISEVVTASAESSTAFTLVAEGIHNTDQIVQQIKGAMQEQQQGSKQISSALHAMNNSTSEVRTASTEMSAGNKAILEEVKELQNATMSMKDSMSLMTTSAQKINETGSALAEISSKMKESIDDIAAQVDQFHV